MLARVVMRLPVRTGVRAMSTAEVNWESLRRKIVSDSGREDLARFRNVFEERKAATSRVADAPDIDWEHYAEALPEYNMAEIKANFDSFMEALPTIDYDAAEDIKDQQAKEDRASRLQKLSAMRFDEILTLQDEADDFALHDFTGAHEMYLRHPGLYEQIQEEVLDREYYRDLDPADKPTELSDEEASRVETELLAKAGLNKADFAKK